MTMNKETLAAKKVETLREMAKMAKITGRSKMNKAALVEALAEYCVSMAPETPEPTETTARIVSKPEAPIAPPAPKPAPARLIGDEWKNFLLKVGKVVRENPGRTREDLMDIAKYGHGIHADHRDLETAVTVSLAYERACTAARENIKAGKFYKKSEIERMAGEIAKTVICSAGQAMAAIYECINARKAAHEVRFTGLLETLRKRITPHVAQMYDPSVKNEVFRATKQIIDEVYGRKRLEKDEFRDLMAAVWNVLTEVRGKLAADTKRVADERVAREAEEAAKNAAKDKARNERLALIKDQMFFVRPVGSSMNGFPVFPVANFDEAGMVLSDQEKSFGKDRVTVLIDDEYYTVTRATKGGRLGFSVASNLEVATRKPAPARNASAATPAPTPAVTLPALQTQMWVTAADKTVGTVKAHVLMGVNGTDASALYTGLAGKLKAGEYLAIVNGHGNSVSMLYRMDEKALAAIGNGRQATREERRAAKAA